MPLDSLLTSLTLTIRNILNNMSKIDITEILGSTLQSRVRVYDLEQYIINSQVEEVELDFNNVKFATRSFMDEFYRVFLSNARNNSFQIHLVNMPSDINSMLESVSRTQSGVPTVKATANVTEFGNIAEAEEFLKTATF